MIIIQFGNLNGESGGDLELFYIYNLEALLVILTMRTVLVYKDLLFEMCKSHLFCLFLLVAHLVSKLTKPKQQWFACQIHTKQK